MRAHLFVLALVCAADLGKAAHLLIQSDSHCALVCFLLFAASSMRVSLEALCGMKRGGGKSQTRPEKVAQAGGRLSRRVRKERAKEL